MIIFEYNLLTVSLCSLRIDVFKNWLSKSLKM